MSKRNLTEFQKVMIEQLLTLSPNLYTKAQKYIKDDKTLRLHYKRADVVINIDWSYNEGLDLYDIKAYLMPSSQLLLSPPSIIDDNTFTKLQERLINPKTIEKSGLYFDIIPDVITRLITNEAKEYQKELDKLISPNQCTNEFEKVLTDNRQ